MTKDEALKLALKALETNNKAWKHLADSGDAGFWEAEEQPFYELSVKAITAIKEALAQPEHGWTPERIAGMTRLKEAQDKKLAQPEQEPVGEVGQIDIDEDGVGYAWFTIATDGLELGDKLYTTPPQRTWVEIDGDDWIRALELADFDKVAAFEFFENKLKELNT